MSSDPWARLAPKPSNLLGNRVDGDHALDAYWVRRSDGARGVVFYGVELDAPGEPLPCLKGVDAVAVNGAAPELGLFLLADEHREVFQLLCEDVIEASRRSTSKAAATVAIHRRLEHWTEMLAAGRGRQMGEHAVRGLFGELIFLRDLGDRLGLNAALEAWVAPDDHPQDFCLPAGIVEVKTRLAAARSLVSISSLEQLETGELPLALWVVEITPDQNGASLNTLADELLERARAEDLAMAHRMQLAMLRRGYERLDAYDSPRYRVSGTRAFTVAAGFPRVIRSATDLGVRTATYQLDLTALGPFESVPDQILTSYSG